MVGRLLKMITWRRKTWEKRRRRRKRRRKIREEERQDGDEGVLFTAKHNQELDGRDDNGTMGRVMD
jgi:hypothetical protein